MPGTLLGTDTELNPSESIPVPTTHISHPIHRPLQNFQYPGCRLENIQAGKNKIHGKGSINPLEQGTSNKTSPEQLSHWQGAGAGAPGGEFPKDWRGKGCLEHPLFTLTQELEAAQEGRAAAAWQLGRRDWGAESFHRKDKELLKGVFVPHIIPWKKIGRVWVD